MRYSIFSLARQAFVAKKAGADEVSVIATVSLRAVGPGIWQICGDADRVPKSATEFGVHIGR